MRKLIFILIAALFWVIPDETISQRLSSYFPDLPQEIPEKQIEYTSVDSIYFEHLGYSSIPVSGGSFLLYDRMNPVLLQVNEDGTLKEVVAIEGRGPGEIGDILFLQKTGKNYVLLVDQSNQKVIRFGTDGSFLDEFRVKPLAGTLVEIFPADEPGSFVNVYGTHEYLRDESKSPALILAQYSRETNKHENSIRLKSRRYARLIIDGQLRGARAVPFTPDQLLAYSPTSESLFAWWTGSAEIAELSANFDTLNTISVQLPRESLSSSEWDSLKEQTNSQQWRTLRGHLPEEKVPVESMKMDYKGRFWLKLNYRADFQPWMVMAPDGTFLKIVHLPRGTMLTHISEHHLGVRLNSYTFALFEPVD